MKCLVLLGVIVAAATALDCTGTYVSDTVPTSVHSLKVGDIKVVAGIGDSMTAGNGAKASSIFGSMTEYRHYGFSAGGAESFDDGITTFPNILKEFNPDLHGFAVGTGNEHSSNAHLNVGKLKSSSSKLLGQAELVVQKMRENDHIDITNDWKVINILNGGLDVCTACQKENPIEEFTNNVKAALDHLHQNSPRTLVNLMQTFDLKAMMGKVKTVTSCRMVLSFFKCPCINKPGAKTIADFNKALEDLVASGRYDTKDDFTIVMQPFLKEIKAPTTADGSLDFSFFAPDCFNLSVKGQGIAGVALWNNMVQPAASKKKDVATSDTALCPSTTYIPTGKN